jgi:hypothetical protein
MKTAMTGDDADGHIIYNAPDLVWPALRLRCKSLPAISDQDQGQSGAADQLIRRDIFLSRTFRNLDDLNAQLEAGSATVANVRAFTARRSGWSRRHLPPSSRTCSPLRRRLSMNFLSTSKVAVSSAPPGCCFDVDGDGTGVPSS